MKFARALLGAVAFASLLAPIRAATANVWIVAPSGGTFTDIQPAVDAASDGDVVLVKNGSYGSFVVANKTLSIVAEAGHSPFVTGAVRIRNVPAGKSVLVAGLTAQGTSAPVDTVTHGLYVSNCQGDVRLQDCVFRALATAAQSGAEVLNSPRVSFARCSVEGSDASSQSSGAGPGLRGLGSQIAMYDAVLLGGEGWNSQCVASTSCEGSGGADGATLTSTYAFAANSTFEGGDGGNSLGTCPTMGSCFHCSCYGDGTYGGNGFRAITSAVNSLACSLQGGAAGVPGCGCGICGCSCCGGSGAAGQGAVGFTPNDLVGPSRRMSAPHVVRELAPWSLSFHGQPGDQVYLFVVAVPEFAFSGAQAGVQLTSPTPTEMPIRVGRCNALGDLTATFTFPDLGAGEFVRRWFVQPTMVDGAGVRRLGTPNDVVVLDSSL